MPASSIAADTNLAGKYSSFNKAYNKNTGTHYCSVYSSSVHTELVRAAVEFESSFLELNRYPQLTTYKSELWIDNVSDTPKRRGVVVREPMKRLHEIAPEEMLSSVGSFVHQVREYIDKLEHYFNKIGKINGSCMQYHGYLAPKSLFVNIQTGELQIVNLYLGKLALLCNNSWGDQVDRSNPVGMYFKPGNCEKPLHADLYAGLLSVCASIAYIHSKAPEFLKPLSRHTGPMPDSVFTSVVNKCKELSNNELNNAVTLLEKLRWGKALSISITPSKGILSGFNRKWFNKVAGNNVQLQRWADTIVAYDVFNRERVQSKLLPPAAGKRNSLQKESMIRPLLLIGAPGTGKSRLAKKIHEVCIAHDTKQGTAVPQWYTISCGGMDAQLILSDLFGHVKGAYTDAKQEKQGLFEKVGNGTLFIDELQDIRPEVQQQLLLVLQSGLYTPIGAVEPKEITCRLIFAANEPVDKMKQSGVLRDDFFQRITSYVVTLATVAEMKDAGDTDGLTEVAETVLQVFLENLPRRIRWIMEKKSLLDLSGDEMKLLDIAVEILGNIRCREHEEITKSLLSLAYPENFRSAEKYGLQMIDLICQQVDTLIEKADAQVSVDKLISGIEKKLPLIVKKMRLETQNVQVAEVSDDEFISRIAKIVVSQPKITREEMVKKIHYPKSVPTFSRDILQKIKEKKYNKPECITDLEWGRVQEYAMDRKKKR